MKWTEPKDPKKEISYYTHVKCQTPLGEALIEWKGWKENQDFCINIDDKYITTEYTLDDAKNTTEKYLIDKYLELKTFLNL